MAELEAREKNYRSVTSWAKRPEVRGGENPRKEIGIGEVGAEP